MHRFIWKMNLVLPTFAPVNTGPPLPGSIATHIKKSCAWGAIPVITSTKVFAKPTFALVTMERRQPVRRACKTMGIRASLATKDFTYTKGSALLIRAPAPTGRPLSAMLAVKTAATFVPRAIRATAVLVKRALKIPVRAPTVCLPMAPPAPATASRFANPAMKIITSRRCPTTVPRILKIPAGVWPVRSVSLTACCVCALKIPAR